MRTEMNIDFEFLINYSLIQDASYFEADNYLLLNYQWLFLVKFCHIDWELRSNLMQIQTIDKSFVSWPSCGNFFVHWKRLFLLPYFPPNGFSISTWISEIYFFSTTFYLLYFYLESFFKLLFMFAYKLWIFLFN